jgi:hypothetical protein
MVVVVHLSRHRTFRNSTCNGRSGSYASSTFQCYYSFCHNILPIIAPLFIIILVAIQSDIRRHYDRTIHPKMVKRESFPMMIQAFTIIPTSSSSRRRSPARHIKVGQQPFHQNQQQQVKSRRIIGRKQQRYCPLYCICINCSRVIDCTAYHFVETKHEQPHMTLQPTFTPRNGSPTIHVNVRTKRSSKNTMQQIWSEHVQETQQAMKTATTKSTTTNVINHDSEMTPNHFDDDKKNRKEELAVLHGNTIYDVQPVTTYEYDVVSCQDYREDIGCWIRHMPEEIRKANPNFIPS